MNGSIFIICKEEALKFNIFAASRSKEVKKLETQDNTTETEKINEIWI